MHDVDLFQRALGLVEPWTVVDVEFDAEQRRLDLRIDFSKGSRFACPECGREGCKVHDTRDADVAASELLSSIEAYLHARVPRVSVPSTGSSR